MSKVRRRQIRLTKGALSADTLDGRALFRDVAWNGDQSC